MKQDIKRATNRNVLLIHEKVFCVPKIFLIRESNFPESTVGWQIRDGDEKEIFIRRVNEITFQLCWNHISANRLRERQKISHALQ